MWALKLIVFSVVVAYYSTSVIYADDVGGSGQIGAAPAPNVAGIQENEKNLPEARPSSAAQQAGVASPGVTESGAVQEEVSAPSVMGAAPVEAGTAVESKSGVRHGAKKPGMAGGQ